MLNEMTEAERVMQIMRETNGQPEERERRLAILAREHNLCPGVVCKCSDPESTFCPRHGCKK